MSNSEPTLSVFFAVKIDDNDLGTFNSCEGLGCEVVIEQREEGGNNAFVWQLPTRLNNPWEGGFRAGAWTPTIMQ